MIYDAEKDILLNTSYKLEDELDKIYFLYTKNKLTKEEAEELEELARENANPVNSYAPIQEQIDNIYTELNSIKAEIKELKGQTGEEPGEPTEPEPVEEYPEYVQPTGAHDAYNTGDKITYNNKKYVCKMDGCVWTPDAYPPAWQEVVDSTENSAENAEVVAENTEENEIEE